MKKSISITYLFFILLTCHSFAGTTTLVTYFAPPTAAYNQVKLASNYAIPTTLAANFCTGTNNGALYIDSNTGAEDSCTGAGASAFIANRYCNGNQGAVFTNNAGALYECTNVAGFSTPYCSVAPTGSVLADYTGVLHVCMAGQDSIYPQECYNDFCSYDMTDPNGPISCSYANVPCQAGFHPLQTLGNTTYTDSIWASKNTFVVSYVCCSG